LKFVGIFGEAIRGEYTGTVSTTAISHNKWPETATGVLTYIGSEPLKEGSFTAALEGSQTLAATPYAIAVK
jgi:hypothetical protein